MHSRNNLSFFPILLTGMHRPYTPTIANKFIGINNGGVLIGFNKKIHK
jgi:hypothetical protein